MNEKKAIVALDGIPAKEAIRIAKLLSGHVWGFKVNDLLFNDSQIVKRLKRYGRVFADAKLHDIPNTVSNSVKRLSKSGADIITVHASGGSEMIRAAKKAAGKAKIVTVTVLTSSAGSKKRVLKLARIAISAGADGVVCSGKEVAAIKKLPGGGKLLRIVPGIRSKGSKSRLDDQKRIVTARYAIENGATHIVIGRPITQSKKDPLRALNLLLGE